MARPALSLAAGAVVTLVLALVLIRGGDSHELRASFDSALQIKAGQQVRIAGRNIGSIASVKLEHGRAVVSMNIDDDAWPLRRGTTAQLRFGAPAAYAARYVQLVPGPARAPELRDRALLPAADALSPVEFDQIFATLGPRARGDLSGLLTNARVVLDGRGDDLRKTIGQSGRGIDGAAGFVGDLGGDAQALDTLVRAGARTAAALQNTAPHLEALVGHAADTFKVAASNATALELTLARLPGTLAAAQPTLRHLDASLGDLGALVTDLGPGARGLRRIAVPLRSTLSTVNRLAPIATATLRTGTREAPRLRSLLRTARRRTPVLKSILAQAEPMVACVRPYGPELAATFANWSSFTSYYDTVGPLARVILVQTPAYPGVPHSSEQLTELPTNGLRYAFPRPPGLNAGTPWFQPECGAGPDALDASKDPETK